MVLHQLRNKIICRLVKTKPGKNNEVGAGRAIGHPGNHNAANGASVNVLHLLQWPSTCLPTPKHRTYTMRTPQNIRYTSIVFCAQTSGEKTL